MRALGVVVLCALPLAAAAGQAIPRSQLAGVSQNLAGAQIEVTYRRPTAHGRSLFGALVPWGAVWSPSADSAPVFTTSAALEVNGSTLPAGTYSLWAIPGESEWTWIFNSRAHVFHMRYPGGGDVLRVTSKPATAEHVETLTFDFPLADADSAVLRLHWGSTVVPLRLRAKPR